MKRAIARKIFRQRSPFASTALRSRVAQPDARPCFICHEAGLCSHREPAVLAAETEQMERWQRLRGSSPTSAPAAPITASEVNVLEMPDARRNQEREGGGI